MTTDLEIWQRAFKLAHFIHCDLRVALCVMVHGMELAALKARQQEERTGANLMKMSDCQLFQVGLLQASEFYERRQEQAQFDDARAAEWEKSLLEQLIELAFSTEGLMVGPHIRPLTNEDLIIRYLKHLALVTVTRNAYQVMVGISQFLYRHGVKEMEHIHLLIDPDLKRGGVSGKSYKTSRKRIWNEMVSRFGNLLELRGKGRFHAQERTLPLLALVNDCLDHLALWDTKHLVFTDEPHQAHALIHPACYERILKQLRIKDPTANLTIPQFALPTHNNFPSRPERRQPPDLTRQQLQLLQEICGKLGKRRKESEPMLLSVRIDGKEQARFNLFSEQSFACPIRSSSKIIEIYSLELDGDLLLAACWLAEMEEIETPHVIAETRGEGGQLVRFDIAFAENGPVTVEINYRETRPARWLALEWKRLTYRLAAIQLKPAMALVIGTLLVGFLIALSVFWLRQKPSEAPEVVKQPSSTIAPTPADSPRVESPFLAENRGVTKEGTGSEQNSSRRTRGLPLGSVTRIYVQSVGEDEFGTALREALIDRLKQSQLIVEERILPTTEAVLQQEANDGKQLVKLRLVNKAGVVLWQASFKQTDARQIAELAIKNLVETIELVKRQPK
ncbi:MAG: hypothetical protein JNK38_17750 [Acidobacteria bacterium]|nr:hypothetical protein [Acidobacteriota bacterium]